MSEQQLKMSMIIDEIKNSVEEEPENYYGIMINVYNDIDKYLDKLDDIKDKIFLAQWCNNYEKVKELIGQVSLSDYEMSKYLQLKEKNSEINETINFRILSEKYKFLDNIMDMITTDIDIQDQILSMSSSRLKIFEKIYLRLQSLTDYYNPYITIILKRMGYVSNAKNHKNGFHNYDDLLKNIEYLIENGHELKEEDIDTLLYLFTSMINYNVSNIDEMRKFGEVDTMDNMEFDKLTLEATQEKNIEILKFVILAKTYGIGLESAKEICEKFNINDIEITSENKDVFEMYMAIYQIVNENDFNVLIQLHDEFTKLMQPQKDFRRTIVFENDLRKAFAQELNSQVYKIDNNSFTEHNGIKVYDAGTDFKMVITAIGAYQKDFPNQENYSKYWNSSKIRSHGNCCSLIGNSNLSMATVRNVIFGFSTMSNNMLLLSGNIDINSTPNSREFDTTARNARQKYMNAEEMLNNTRGDYNELVYERRDLSSNPKFYKKNPDYIVFIEEYENFNEMFEKFKDDPRRLEYLKQQKEIQDKQWQESMKAAADFNIPIVKINREKIAKSELSKVQQMVTEFKETRNPILFEKIITKFENNRVGNSGLHAPIREKYFSSEMINSFIVEIKNIINSIESDTIKDNLYFSLYNAIVLEQEKVEYCEKRRVRKKQQIPGINFVKELEEIKQNLSSSVIDYEIIGRKK